MKKIKELTICIFFVILILPMLLINLKNNQISEIDNELLPELSSITNINTLEDYLKKRIGFRSLFIRLYTKINNDIFHKMIHPLYDYGENNYVYFKMENEVLDYDFLDSYVLLIKNMQDYVQSRGSHFIYVINPTKKSVYKDFLPEGYNFNDTRIKYLKNKLDELEINYLDNTDILIKKSKEYSVFNKQYDAGHWNDYGAFFGINNLYSRLQQDGINVNNLDINDYNIRTEKVTTLPVSEFNINENIPMFELKKLDYNIEEIVNDIRIDSGHNYALKTTNNNREIDMLIFRGSYFNRKEKFIASNFRNVYYIHNYVNAIDIDYYYNLSNHPQVVVFTGVEYAIKNGYYTKNAIESKEYNVVYDNFNELDSINISNDFLKEIRSMSNGKLIENEHFLDISFYMEDIKYAYLLINNNPYDITKKGNQFYITLPKNIMINSKVKLVFIDNELNKLVFNMK